MIKKFNYLFVIFIFSFSFSFLNCNNIKDISKNNNNIDEILSNQFYFDDSTLSADAPEQRLQFVPAAAGYFVNTKPADSAAIVKYTKSGLTAVNTGNDITFSLHVNSNGIGVVVQVLISFDFNGDGNTDAERMYDYFAIDGSDESVEEYTESTGLAVTAGALQDLNNGSITIEIWNCFGGSNSLIVEGEAKSMIEIPFDFGGGTSGEEPVITSIPDVNEDDNIIIYGSNFTAQSRVHISGNGIDEDTAILSWSSGQLNAENIYSSGTYIVVVHNGLLSSNSESCVINEAQTGPIINVGKGSYTMQLPPGRSGPQAAIYKTANVTTPVPTHDWWSALAWVQYSEGMFPHPLSVKCTDTGLEISYPQKNIVNHSDGEKSILRKHSADLEVRASNFSPADARLHKFSDWSIDIMMANGSDQMIATVTHGSPYVYFTYSSGANSVIIFDESPVVWYGNSASQYIGVTVNGRHYGLFAPAGSTWTGLGSKTVTCNLSAGKNYFSVAALPDASALNDFVDCAYAFIDDTKVEWQYDENSSTLTTNYTVQTIPKEGSSTDTIMALYPHQWRFNTNISPLSYTYESIRGRMKIVKGPGFATDYVYNGILPYLPDAGSYNPSTLYNLVQEEYVKNPIRDGLGNAVDLDTYWYGKNLNRAINLAAIAKQAGHSDAHAHFINAIKSTLEDWLEANLSETNNVFYYDDNWNTLIGYAASYGSDTSLNDHHFHYGYFVHAAALVAMEDKTWALDSEWGGMIKMIIRDYGSWMRGDSKFPFLRTFDPYEGHSWASGNSIFASGNNQESSSEALNAYAGMILWGQATGDAAIRDAGIYMFTTELRAVQNYWFDIHGDVFEPEYVNVDASMIWGGKYDHTTWWTDDPIQVHGINMLPISGHSLFLGLDPDYPEINFDAMMYEYSLLGTSPAVWKDILAEFLALSDPDRALTFWNTSIEPEFGESKAHTYHWIYNLKELGHVDAGVTANIPLYAVFNKSGVKTYAAYNASNSPVVVSFSDGKSLTVSANSIAYGDGN